MTETTSTAADKRGAATRGALDEFVQALSRLIDENPSEGRVLAEAGRLLAALVAHDDWLPAAFAVAGPEHYRQYPLYIDPHARFSVISFVWGPGQKTPIHDHTVWGLIGMLRGAECSQAYHFAGPDRLVASGKEVRLVPGQVEAVSPSIGDIHLVRNAYEDRDSISIHIYGADIGQVKRSTYGLDGRRKGFVSGYSAVQ